MDYGEKITEMPNISVVMSVYNGKKYLRKAIDSILNQTYTDFEFIIINDCSTDKTNEILQSYHDKRIKIINNEQNLRLPASLNKGLRLVKGKYIARMDADDIALTDRFEKQVKYLESHPDVAVIGGSFEVFNEQKGTLYVHKAYCNEMLERYYLIPSPIGHPTAMLRKSMTVDEGFFYDEKYTSAQDYDLWLRIAQKHKINNIPDIVLKYRVHENSISRKRTEEQQMNARNIFLKNISCDISAEEAKAILRQEYNINPIKHAQKFYQVFPYCNYFYLRNILGYTYRYIQNKI